MSLAALAAAATVFDTIDEVARDARMSVPVARAALVRWDIASVSECGVVSMSENQSMAAARVIENMEGQ